MEPASDSDLYIQPIILLIDAISGQQAVAFLFLIFLLLLISALVSGSEVAFFSLKAKQLDVVRQEESKASKRVIQLLNQPRYLLSTILIVNNLANIGLVITSYSLLSFYYNPQPIHILKWVISPTIIEFVVSVIGVTGMLVLFGEIIPKVYASRYSLKLAKMMSYPLLQLKQFFWYLSTPMVYLSKWLEKNTSSENQMNKQELDRAIDIAAKGNNTDQDVHMLKGLVKFGDITVKQIMCSRVDVVGIDIQTMYSDVIETIKESGYSRIPVYAGDLDTIKGVLYAKDLIKFFNTEPNDWTQLIRPPFFVPESKKINDLLSDFQQKRIHMAVVVDEYGGTEGIVTLEDVLEEVVGEIKDEFDEDEAFEYTKLNDNTYEFDGRLLINDMCKIMQIDVEQFDAVRGESDSIGGLILELSGQMPEQLDEQQFEQYKFKVLSIDENRIERVALTIDNKKTNH